MIHPSWEPYIGQVLRRALPGIQAAIGDNFLPPREDVLRAFAMPHGAVRVLIVGQDPYPTPGHAMGLAFSTRPGVPAPRSLRNIYRELTDDLGLPGRADGDLTAWERQGVLMLNRVLTVAPGQAGAHRGIGWEAVTEAAIASLNRPELVALLWGRDAQACAPLLADAAVINAPHPSPLSARRGFFGSKPFSRANDLLFARGVKPVDWRL